MEVVLGPAATQSSYYGSTPSTDTPRIMRKLKDNYSSYNWIAGHLLNDNMGGDGVAQNLTPLTKLANREHATHEGRIKKAIDRAYSHAQFNPTHGYWYGIRYKVELEPGVLDPKKTHLDKVPKGIVINASPIKQDKKTNSITGATGGPMSFSSINDVTILNR